MLFPHLACKAHLELQVAFFEAVLKATSIIMQMLKMSLDLDLLMLLERYMFIPPRMIQWPGHLCQLPIKSHQQLLQF